jgi:hypothetical protein
MVVEWAGTTMRRKLFQIKMRIRSISTIIPHLHELESVMQDDDGQLAAEATELLLWPSLPPRAGEIARIRRRREY